MRNDIVVEPLKLVNKIGETISINKKCKRAPDGMSMRMVCKIKTPKITLVYSSSPPVFSTFYFGNEIYAFVRLVGSHYFVLRDSSKVSRTLLITVDAKNRRDIPRALEVALRVTTISSAVWKEYMDLCLPLDYFGQNQGLIYVQKKDMLNRFVEFCLETPFRIWYFLKDIIRRARNERA